MSNEISFLMSIGWLNSWACCQATSPFPPMSEAVSLKDLEPVRKEVVNGSFSVNKNNREFAMQVSNKTNGETNFRTFNCCFL